MSLKKKKRRILAIILSALVVIIFILVLNSDKSTFCKNGLYNPEDNSCGVRPECNTGKSQIVTCCYDDSWRQVECNNPSNVIGPTVPQNWIDKSNLQREKAGLKPLALYYPAPTYPENPINTPIQHGISITNEGNSDVEVWLEGVSFSQHCKDSSIVGWWDMDDDSNIVQDYSGNNIEGQAYCYNKGLTFIQGKFAGGFAITSTTCNTTPSSSGYDVPNVYIDSSPIVDEVWNMSRDYSISIWLKPRGYSIPAAGLFHRETSQYPWGLRMNGFSVGAIAWNGSNNPGINSANMALNVWHHTVLTWNATSKIAALYLDGVANGTAFSNFTTNPMYQPQIRIGSRGHPANFSREFNGSVDDARLYNKTLSQSEITQLYQGQGCNPAGMTELNNAWGGIIGRTHSKMLSPSNFDVWTTDWIDLDNLVNPDPAYFNSYSINVLANATTISGMWGNLLLETDFKVKRDSISIKGVINL